MNHFQRTLYAYSLITLGGINLGLGLAMTFFGVEVPPIPGWVFLLSGVACFIVGFCELKDLKDESTP